MADLPVTASERRRAYPTDGPRRERGDDLRPVHRELAARLGEDLVVAEQHSHAPDRRVKGREALAGCEDPALRRRQMDLAMPAQHAVSGKADSARIAAFVVLVSSCLGVADADRRRASDADQARDLVPVGVQRGRRTDEPECGGPTGTCACGRWTGTGRSLCGHRQLRFIEIAAERALRKHYELGAAAPSLADDLLDLPKALIEVAAKGAGHRGDGRAGMGAGSHLHSESIDARAFLDTGRRAKM